MLKWEFILKEEKPIEGITNEKKYALRRGKYEKMNVFLSEIDWKTLFENKTMDQRYETFLEQLNTAMDRYIPKTTGTIKESNWLSKELRELKNKVKSLWFKNKAINWRLSKLKKQHIKAKKEF